jgi:hypothetical protein
MFVMVLCSRIIHTLTLQPFSWHKPGREKGGGKRRMNFWGGGLWLLQPGRGTGNWEVKHPMIGEGGRE